MARKQSGRLLAELTNLRNLNTESTRHNLKLPSKSSNDLMAFQSLGCYSRWRTSCKAVALCPVTSRHMMICSSRMTWNVDRMGLLSSTLNTHGQIRVGSTSPSSRGEISSVSVFQQTYSSASPAAWELCQCTSGPSPSSPPASSASPSPLVQKKTKNKAHYVAAELYRICSFRMHDYVCNVHQPFKLFWWEMPSFGDITCRDVCLLLNIMKLDGAQQNKERKH